MINNNNINEVKTTYMLERLGLSALPSRCKRWTANSGQGNPLVCWLICFSLTVKSLLNLVCKLSLTSTLFGLSLFNNQRMPLYLYLYEELALTNSVLSSQEAGQCVRDTLDIIKWCTRRCEEQTSVWIYQVLKRGHHARSGPFEGYLIALVNPLSGGTIKEPLFLLEVCFHSFNKPFVILVKIGEAALLEWVNIFVNFLTVQAVLSMALHKLAFKCSNLLVPLLPPVM